MDHSELVRLAGEQALLGQDIESLQVDQARDMRSLEMLPHHVLLQYEWLEEAVSLLRRIDARQKNLAQCKARMEEYRKLTGIKP